MFNADGFPSLYPTNGFSKKLDHHTAAQPLYVTHYTLCRVHEALRTMPGPAFGVADGVWSIGGFAGCHAGD